MRISIVTIGAALIAAAALSPTSAGATTYSQAQKICAKNPNCHEAGGNGSGMFCVGPKSDVCQHIVTCDISSPNGKCYKRQLQPGGKRKPIAGNVGTVLTSAPDKLTKPVTGDRAKPDGAQKQPNKVVRDHRTDPVVRDHRDKSVRAEGQPRAPVSNRK